jgi:formamidase
MHDLVAGTYRLPWEDEVVHVDGRSCGFPPPTRNYAPQPAVAVVKKTA